MTLAIDVPRIQAYFETPAGVVEPEQCVLPNQAASAVLYEHLGRLHIKNFFMACVRAVEVLPMPLRRDFVLCVQRLQALPMQTVARCLLQPKLAAWIRFTLSALEAGAAANVQALARWLPTLLADVLVAHAALQPGDQLQLIASAPGRFRFQALGYDIALDEAQAVLQATANGRHRLGGVDVDDEAAFQRIPCVSGIALLAEDAYLRELIPRAPDQRAQLDEQPSVETQRALHASVQAGMRVLAEHWPIGLAEVQRSVHTIVALKGEGLSPMNASLTEFRGLVGTTARPSYLSAQSLIHEAGHNRLDTLLDLVPLTDNPPAQLYFSPFVQTARPMDRIAHGALAFLQDVVISRKLHGRVEEIPGWELEPYIARMAALVDDGLAVIRAHAVLTDAGSRFVQRMTDVLSEYR